MLGPSLTEFERDVRRIPGVRSARVVGDDRIDAVHVVSSSVRPAADIVSDVCALAGAVLGSDIEPGVVAVVELDDAAPRHERSAAGVRCVVERVVVATKGERGWVKVALRWPDGRLSEGVGAAGATRATRARAAAVAVGQALVEHLSATSRHIDVDHVQVGALGANEAVSVAVTLVERGRGMPLVGSALVYDDVATAAVRATLDAVNRRLA